MILLTVTALYAQAFAADCKTIEGEIHFWNGWPPAVRIESKDKKHVFGIETNDEVTQSDYMPESLLKLLQENGAMTGSFCVKLTGSETTVPYDKRKIKYVKVVRYKIKSGYNKQLKTDAQERAS